MYNVFDLVLTLDNEREVTCGAAKSAFLSGHCRFSKAFFSKHVRPLALLALTHDIFDTFAPLYTDEPIMPFWYKGEERTEMADTIKRHGDAVALSVERLQSSTYLTSRFRHWLHSYRDLLHPEIDWLPDDGAVDQFRTPPPKPRSTTVNSARSSRKRVADVEESLPPAKSPRLSARADTSAGASARAACYSARSC